MLRDLCLLPLALLLASSVGCSSGGAEPAAPTEDAGADVAPLPPQTLAVRSIDVYQSVQIPLMRGGVAVEERNAPLIAGRDAILRIAVKPGPAWKRKKIHAQLTIATHAGVTSLDLTREIGPAGSLDGEYQTTFNFELAKELIAPEATFAVAIDNEGELLARYPESEGLALHPVRSGALKVKLVPVRWDLDESGRLPNLEPGALDTYRDNLFGMFPVSDVELTVREPMPWNEQLAADGTGWGSLLNAIVRLRNADKAPADVYYYGIFTPADSFWKYCSHGCVMGLSGLLTDPSDSFGRGSIGLGYGDEQSAKTLVHELGHAHGRAHAPCGDAAYIDRKYPYPGGEIGVFGWDAGDKRLIDQTFSDVMGYCSPVWVSDYTYRAFFERVSHVNKLSRVITAGNTSHRYRFVHVERDGKLRWGDTTITDQPPLGEPHTMTFTADDGSVQKLTGHYYPFADLGGGYLVVPEPSVSVARVAVEGMPAGVQPELLLQR